MPSVVFREQTLSYELGEHEPPGDGKHLLFLHGNAGTLASWETHLHEESQYNDTYAIDLPGHGRSGGAPLPSVAAYRDMLSDFMQGMAIEPAVLVGHTLGGLVAVALATHSPDAVEAVVLVSPYVKWRASKATLKALSQAVETGTTPALEPDLYAQGASDLVLQWARRQQERVSAETLLLDLTAYADFDLANELLDVKQPALLIVGAKDRRATESEARALAATMPNATVAVVPNASHMVMVEQPPAFQQILDDFLATL